MAFTIKVEVPASRFASLMTATEKDMAAAATAAMYATGAQALVAAKGNVAAAGFPSQTFEKATILRVYPKNRDSLGVAAMIANKVPFSELYEDGGEITSSSPMWVPFSSTPRKIGNRRLTPKVFRQMVGPLVTAPFTTKAGHPILAAPMRVDSKSDRIVSLNRLLQGARQGLPSSAARRGKGGAIASVTATTSLTRLQPLFYGIEAVKVRKRFDIKATVTKAAASFGPHFVALFDQIKAR